MAFLDKPQVDESSKRSEESILVIQKWFSRKNNFISRTETPDYGVDLTFELMTNGKEATGKIFSSQVKSTTILKTVTKEKKLYVKYAGFETSRLCYIQSRTPGMGLIILYEENTEKCYFDYIENIIEFITEDKGNEDWKNNKDSTIYLPIENTLTLENVNDIHRNMLNRFNNHDLLIKDHGKDYGFNISDSNSPIDITKLDESNPILLSKWLETYGVHLINLQAFVWLSDLVSKLRYEDIKNSKILSLLTYVAYIQTEKIPEANLYMHRCKFYFNQYSKQEQEIIQVSDLKLQVYLGSLALNETFSKIETLLSSSQNKSVILSLKVWYMRIQLLIMYQNVDFNEDYFNKVQKVFSEIMDYNDLEEELKFTLVVQNCESLFGLYSHYQLEAIFKEEIYEKKSGKISETEKNSIWRPAFELFDKLINFLNSALKYAEEKEIKKLKALVMFSISKYHWLQLLNFIHYKKFDYKWNEKTELLMELLRKNAMDSARIFNELGLSNDGYKSLCIAYEIVIFSEKIYNHNLCYSEKRLREYLTGTEKNLEIERPYESITENRINKLKEVSKISVKEESFIMNENEIEKKARILLNSLNLPKERLENIKLSLKNHSIFYKNNKNPKIKLIEDKSHGTNHETLFAYPILYVIQNQETGFQSIPNTNVEELINKYPHFFKSNNI